MAQVHWKAQVSADFNTAADWSTGAVPGASDDAILDAAGATPYTVTASTAETVNSIQLASTATLEIHARTFTATKGTASGANAGTIQVDNNYFFAVGGAVDNIGAITLNSVGNATEFTLNANTTLSGGGKVTLSNSGANYVFGASATDILTNVDNTISGAGQLGDGQMTLVNQAKGVINATGSVALVLNTAGETVTNAGLLEATGTAGLTILSTTVHNSTTGVIQANTGSSVNLRSADIIGGTLKTSGTGVIQAVDRGSVLDGTTSAVSNTGVLNIVNNYFLTVEGTIANTGSINLNSIGNTTELVVGTAGVTLNGGGKVSLTNSTANYILGSAAADTLTNFNNIIAGSGQLGSGQMTLVNQAAGVIDATGASVALVLNTTGETVTNAGLIEGTGTAGLRIVNTTVNDSTGGKILAATGSNVSLQGADIIGGTLTTSGTGVIQAVDRTSVLDGTTLSVTNNATVNIVNNDFLKVQGTIANSATASINLDSGGNTTALVVGAPGVTLTGGVVVLSDFAANIIYGVLSGPSGSQTVATLTNKTTIRGAGFLGDNQMSLVNSGTIDATGATALVLQTGGGNIAGSNTVVNSGLLEATNPGALGATGGLNLRSVVVSNGKTGVIEANGATTHVDLQSADIVGGTLKTLNGGVIQTSANDRGSLLDGTTFTVNNTGVLNITNNAFLTVQGTINNTGSINLNSIGNDTRLLIGANTTLIGGGPLTLSDSSGNSINGNAAGDVLTNVSSTISGSGSLGLSQLTLVNQAAGVIDATGSAATLIINTSGETFTNAGLVEGTGTAGLVIQSTVVDDSGGGVISAGAGSSVSLTADDIIGGTLKTTGSGVIETSPSDRSSLLDGNKFTVNNAGVFDITNNAFLTVQGTINNTGSFNLNSVGNDTRLLIGAPGATLTGGGKVTLSDNTGNSINGVVAGDVLINVDNTISGAGSLGLSQLTLINQAAGVIDASGANALTLNTGSNVVTNTGLIEATGAGGLLIQSTTVNGSTGGTILAATGSSVTLQIADIVGGTLSATGTGVFQTASSDRSSLLDGTTSTVNLAGPLNITNNAWLTIQGKINNSGTISVLSGGNDTRLLIGTANATLSGGGHVTLSDNANNSVNGNSAGATLTNVDNTISGAGQFGLGQMGLVNQAKGVIDATGANALVLNTGTNTITNAGLIEATASGGLSVQSAITNTGTLLASGGTLTLVGALTNLAGTTLTGGTYEADAGSTLNLGSSASVVTDNATIIVSGAGSVIQGSATVDSTLTTIGAAGTLEVLAGRNWTSGLAISNAGNLDLGGGTFTVASLANSGTVSGFGVLATTVTNTGVISVQGGQTLSLQGGSLTNLSGSTLTGGTYIVGAGGTLQLANNVSIVTLKATIDLAGSGATLQSFNTVTSKQVSLESTLTTIGTTGVLEILGGRNYNTSKAIGNSGKIQLGGGTFTSGTLTDAAGSTLTGFGTVASAFSDGGVTTSAGGALAFTGTGDTFSTALAGTEIDFAGGTDLLQSGSSLTAGTIGVSGGAVVTLATSQTYAGKWVQGVGTVNLGGNTLTLTGSGSTFAGAINGAGALVFGGGTQALNGGATIGATTWSISGGAAVTVNEALSFGGTFTDGAGTSLTINNADSLTLTGASTFAGAVSGAGTLALSGGADAFNAGASVSVATLSIAGGATVSVNTNLTDTGALAQASGTTLALGANTLTLTGTGSTLAGSVTGSGGTLAFAGGTEAVNAGASLGVSNWSLSGTAATTVNTSLTYAGAFSEGASATLTVATGDTLTLTGAATLSGIVNGAGTVTLSTATFSGLTVGGTAILNDVGTVHQTGAVTIGDASSNAATLMIKAGAVYQIDNNSGIARGVATTSSIKNSGLFIKSGGTGISKIAVKITDTGAIEAASGTLDFTQTISGRGTMAVDSGATLEVGKTAVSTLAMIFNGGNAILALGKVAKFAATINGFAPTDTIDLLKTVATGATLNGSDQLTIVNGATTIATLQLAGTYTGDTFNVVSDGAGGTNITVTTGPAPPPSHQFIAAMAALGAGAAGAVHTAAQTWHAPPPMLTAPRMLMA